MTFLDRIRAFTPSRQSVVSSRGKQSMMKRELEALHKDLSYNKEYKYLFTESDDDQGKQSAMRDPGYLALRGSRIRRKGYEDKSCWGSCKKSVGCKLLTSRTLWTVILVSVVIVLFKMFLEYRIPYCTRLQGEKESGSGCSYNRLWIWDCRPCPRNAVCEGGNLTCNKGYKMKNEELCLKEGENPYVEKLVD